MMISFIGSRLKRDKVSIRCATALSRILFSSYTIRIISAIEGKSREIQH